MSTAFEYLTIVDRLRELDKDQREKFVRGVFEVYHSLDDLGWSSLMLKEEYFEDLYQVCSSLLGADGVGNVYSKGWSNGNV